jgi:hypothetical protein
MSSWLGSNPPNHAPAAPQGGAASASPADTAPLAAPQGGAAKSFWAPGSGPVDATGWAWLPAARAASSAEAAASAPAASQGCSAVADPNIFTVVDATELARCPQSRVSRKKAHSMLKMLREELERTGEHSKDLTDGTQFSWKGYVAAHPDCNHFIGPGWRCLAHLCLASAAFSTGRPCLWVVHLETQRKGIISARRAHKKYHFSS